MNSLTAGILRRALTPSGVSGGDGTAVLHLPLFRLLPAEARPHLHYLKQAMCLLPGVTDAQVDAAKGEATVTYDPARYRPEDIRDWYTTLVEEGLRYATDPQVDFHRLTEAEVIGQLTQRAESRLPGFLAGHSRG